MPRTGQSGVALSLATALHNCAGRDVAFFAFDQSLLEKAACEFGGGVRSMGMTFFRFAALFGMGIGLVADAAAVTPEPLIHQSGRIRVFYHTTGKHAVEAMDSNQNGIPDQVEDALTQTVASRLLWVDVLGFPDPLDSVRYRDAAFLDIQFRHKDVVKGNGKAFDEMHPTRHVGDPEGTLRISIHLATSLKPTTNLTPTHEYFHLIQYASTYFKNRWFTEGTARWSEQGLGDHFWNPLAEMTDAGGEIPDSEALRQLQAMTYTDGSPVLKDLKLTGWQFVREVLLELGREDVVAFRELEYESWAEENQKSPRNNRFLMQAVEKVVEAKRGNDR